MATQLMPNPPLTAAERACRSVFDLQQAQVQPADAQRHPVDVQPVDAQPVDAQLEVQPQDNMVQPVDAQSQPVDAQPKPVDAQPQPVDAQPQPFETQLQPVDAQLEVQPQDNMVQPIVAHLRPVDTQLQWVDAQIQSVKAQIQPVHVQPQDSRSEMVDCSFEEEDMDISGLTGILDALEEEPEDMSLSPILTLMEDAEKDATEEEKTPRPGEFLKIKFGNSILPAVVDNWPFVYYFKKCTKGWAIQDIHHSIIFEDIDGKLKAPSMESQGRRIIYKFEVGNIPYEATEEQLREIFTQAGPVVSFRLVYDRETGKPKGYGFCEYQDVETAQSAMRNLNNYDFNGRPLRVGVAAGEQNRDEMKGMQQAMGGPLLESPFGDPTEPEKAPEAISKAVASLPPEQMFELMKQMKMCIQNNPTEARNLLLQNPQLAYALLQAQIVMKIVDPQVAMAMLHRDTNQIPPSNVPPSSQPISLPPQLRMPNTSVPQGPPNSMGGPMPMGSNIMAPGPHGPGGPGPHGPGGPGSHGPGGPGPHGPGGPGPHPGGPHGPGGPGPRGPGVPGNRGPGGPGPHGPGGPGPGGPRMGGPEMMGRPQGPLMGPGGPQPNMGGPQPNMGGPPMRPDMGSIPQSRPEQRDPRMGDGRGMPPRPGPQSGAPAGIPGLPNLSLGGLQLPGGMPNMSAGASISAQDQEKAALIMQVLQLTDQQIAMLPPDQRQSILILKDQIAKSANP